ncbi:MAG: cytochrome c biogenesis protein CcdA [Thermomicrobiales bacterium]
MDVTIAAAFVAGLLSISSPCILPLIPVYLAHLAGTGAGDQSPRTRKRLLINAGAYIAGFSLVFILLGVALGAAGAAFGTAGWVSGNRGWLVRIGGIFLMLLGLYQIGLIQLPILNRERRLHFGNLESGRVASSFLIGVTFGAGWSPCVGPILGSILTMAASQQDVTQAGWLLVVYSLGLAIPFLGFALAFGSAPQIIRGINRHLPTIKSFSGAVMVGIGAIMILGIYQQFFARLVQVAPWTPWEPVI